MTTISVYLYVYTNGVMHCIGEIGLDRHGHIKKPVFKTGFLQRNVLRADLNPAFAKRADMAIRSAIVCAICATPYYFEPLKFINEHGFSMNYAVVIICFTIYGEMGTTLSLAWYNFAGTVLPTLNVLLMYGL